MPVSNQEKEFVTYVVDLMQSIGPVRAKAMFGGHGIFLERLMFGLIAALLSHSNALRVSEPEEWGLAGKENKTKAYVQCLDAASYTDGVTAILEVSKVDAP